MLRIFLLGGFALFEAESPLPSIPGAAARSLFAYLLTYRERPHTRDLLAGTFWPDLPDAAARRRLSQALWRIRKALAPLDPLRTEGNTVQIDPGLPLWLDIEELEKLRNWDPAKLVDWELESGAGSQSTNLPISQLGEFLAGYYDDWVIVERERLREMYLEVLARLVEGFKARGNYERALTYARRLAEADPWREGAHREAMRLLHLLGRDAEALAQFETCRRVLAEELDVEPSPETVALAAEIAAAADLPAPVWLPAAARPAREVPLVRSDRLPLVGRASELADLLRGVEAAAEGRGGLTLLYGEAGVGKTRLVQELAHNAEWRGLQVVWGRCYELIAPPAYQPLVEALRAGLDALRRAPLEPPWQAELSRLLPELAGDAPLPPPLSPAEERRRLLEAIARGFLALAATTPGLLLLEDAQWMDLSSLEALRYLLPRLCDAPLAVVVTVRSEDLVGPQAGALTALENTRLVHRLDLGRLDLEGTGALVQRALDLTHPAPLFSARLHAETEGNPFFLLETLRTLMDEGLLQQDAAGEWHTPWDEATRDYAELPLPPGVAQSIERRLARLPPPLDQMVDLAAVVGREVSFDLWRQAGGWEEEALLAAGDELCVWGLLCPADPPADYAFAHAQIRRVAYERLSSPRRRLYHRRVAEALSRLAPDEPAVLAYHWSRAEVWDRAAEAHQQAGDRARAVYAYAEAAAHYGAALDALERLPGPPDRERLFALHLVREEVLAQQGERAAQLADLIALADLAERLDDDRRRIEVMLRQADYHLDVSELDQAGDWIEQALRLARSVGDRSFEARGLALLGDLQMYHGDMAASLEKKRQSLALYRALGDRAGEARLLDACGTTAQMAGDDAAGSDYLEQALALYRALGDRRGEIHALYVLGRHARNRGDLGAARRYGTWALEEVRRMGHRNGEAYHRLELGNLYRTVGDYEAARTMLQEAAAIFEQVGGKRGRGYAIFDLSLTHHYLGQEDRALALCRQGQEIMAAVGDRWGQAGGLTYLGLIREGRGELTAAAEAFAQALALKQEIEQVAWSQEDRAGLARIALAQGQIETALAHARQGLTWLRDKGLEGIEHPMQVYLSLWQVLVAAGEQAEADRLLTEAYRRVMDRAGRLEDETTRRSFLENVAENRAIVAAYRRLGRQTARLPRADAPRGRPLRDDEYVTVAWTPTAPEDDEISPKIARRRHRLLRLLREAEEQGASPTVDDLAKALAVSPTTLKRDLAALRREGHPLKTRGSR